MSVYGIRKMLNPHKNYNIIANTVVSGSSTLDDLRRFRGTSPAYMDVVDNYVPRAWVNVLTKEVLDRAFDEKSPDAYVIEQTFKAVKWLVGVDPAERKEKFGNRTPYLEEFQLCQRASRVSVVLPVVVDWIVEYGMENLVDVSIDPIAGPFYGHSDFLYNMAKYNPDVVGRLLRLDTIDIEDRPIGFLSELMRAYKKDNLDVRDLVDDVRLTVRKTHRQLDYELRSACVDAMRMPALPRLGEGVVETLESSLRQ